ncbi:MAG TPA: hypothetical protein PL016_06050 [Kiritimatiellia bacterium]|nr:hypothetical protein [Kiritimatiellia bacterium]
MKKKTRSAAWFLREVRKSIKADPSKPVRFDVEENEMAAVNAAYDELVFVGGNLVPWLKGIAEPPPPPPRHIREGEQPKREAASPKTPLRWRVSFIGPNVFTPAKIIRGTPASRYKGPQEAMEAWCMRLDEVRCEYAPEYHVEGRHVMTRRYGDNRMDYEVWRGEDWLARRYATLYPAEIARLLESGKGARYAVKMMEPHYRKKITMDRRNRENATAGGKARATCTDEQIEAAFTEYRQHNPRNSYASAESFVARKLGYSNPRKLGERIQRMTGNTPAKWYKTLP